MPDQHMQGRMGMNSRFMCQKILGNNEHKQCEKGINIWTGIKYHTLKNGLHTAACMMHHTYLLPSRH